MFYNINTAHRYEVLLTACDKGKPKRCTNATVYIPLQNYNVNPPTYRSPVIIHVAINHPVGQRVAKLNAYDIDGDQVTYALSPQSK